MAESEQSTRLAPIVSLKNEGLSSDDDCSSVHMTTRCSVVRQTADKSASTTPTPIKSVGDPGSDAATRRVLDKECMTETVFVMLPMNLATSLYQNNLSKVPDTSTNTIVQVDNCNMSNLDSLNSNDDLTTIYTNSPTKNTTASTVSNAATNAAGAAGTTSNSTKANFNFNTKHSTLVTTTKNVIKSQDTIITKTKIVNDPNIKQTSSKLAKPAAAAAATTTSINKMKNQSSMMKDETTTMIQNEQQQQQQEKKNRKKESDATIASFHSLGLDYNHNRHHQHHHHSNGRKSASAKLSRNHNNNNNRPNELAVTNNNNNNEMAFNSSLIKIHTNEVAEEEAAKKEELVAQPDESPNDLPQREQWDRKLEFLLAIIGFSVDLGNIWRFPKIVFDNGGGRFLIPYFVQLALCGLPLFYMELALGQFHQTGVFTLWEKICPILKGIAFTAVGINIFLAMFYNTVIAWAVYYFFLSFSYEVPWKGCSNEWNTVCCMPIDIDRLNRSANPNRYDYHRIADDGIFYKLNYDNLTSTARLAIFNLNSNPSDDEIEIRNNRSLIMHRFFGWISQFHELSYLDTSSLRSAMYTEDTVTDEFKVNKWLDSYFILTHNKTRLESAYSVISDWRIFKQYSFDPEMIRIGIEQMISKHYTRLNQTYELVLNCSIHMNNPTQEFYTRHLTEMHKSRGLQDLGKPKLEMILCLFLVFLTVYFALWKGIKSAGKAVWITAIAPYVVLFILLIRGLTLKGSEIGIKFYLTIKSFDDLMDIQLWVDAATQIFFSLGPGFGTIIALSSYNKKKNNIYKDALLTSFINCFTSILSGFVVFSTLGHMAYVQQKDITEVTDAGPGLIFVAYPQAITMMPYSSFWAVIFFFMLFTLGIDSTFGGLESVITGICDAMPHKFGGKRRSFFVLALILICFLASMPTITYGGAYIVHLFDGFAVAPAILFVVFLEVIGIMYAYGCDRFCNDINEMLSFRPSLFWTICWRFISPGIVLVIAFMIGYQMFQRPFQFGNDYRYDGIGMIISILIVCIPISFIFIYAAYRIYVTEGKTLKERLYKITIIYPKENKPKNIIKQPEPEYEMKLEKKPRRSSSQVLSKAPRDPVNL